MKPEQYYNARLARGWTLGLGQELKVLQALIRLSHKSLTAQLQRHWQKHPAGLGGLAGAEFQSRHVSGAQGGAAERALCDHPDRLRRFTAAFLDRAASGAALDLRHRQSGGAGPRRGLRRVAHSRDLRHDHSSGFLPAFDRSTGAPSAASCSWTRTVPRASSCSAATDRRSCAASRSASTIRSSSWSAATIPRWPMNCAP